MTHTSMTSAGAEAIAAPEQGAAGRAQGRVSGQFLRFVLVGGVGTVLYVGFYWLARLVTSQQPANVLSWTIATVLGNLLHRRYTYGVRGSHRQNADAIITFGTALVELLVAAALLARWPEANGWQQSAIVVLGTAIGGTARFVLNLIWFRRT
ncbi:GtrA family protein [Nostocoides veronense]